jgi:hypothetical protein
MRKRNRITIMKIVATLLAVRNENTRSVLMRMTMRVGQGSYVSMMSRMSSMLIGIDSSMTRMRVNIVTM